jgi:hypothetical protein
MPKTKLKSKMLKTSAMTPMIEFITFWFEEVVLQGVRFLRSKMGLLRLTVRTLLVILYVKNVCAARSLSKEREQVGRGEYRDRSVLTPATAMVREISSTGLRVRSAGLIQTLRADRSICFVCWGTWRTGETQV